MTYFANSQNQNRLSEVGANFKSLQSKKETMEVTEVYRWKSANVDNVSTAKVTKTIQNNLVDFCSILKGNILKR